MHRDYHSFYIELKKILDAYDKSKDKDTLTSSLATYRTEVEGCKWDPTVKSYALMWLDKLLNPIQLEFGTSTVGDLYAAVEGTYDKYMRSYLQSYKETAMTLTDRPSVNCCLADSFIVIWDVFITGDYASDLGDAMHKQLAQTASALQLTLPVDWK